MDGSRRRLNTTSHKESESLVSIEAIRGAVCEIKKISLPKVKIIDIHLLWNCKSPPSSSPLCGGILFSFSEVSYAERERKLAERMLAMATSVTQAQVGDRLDSCWASRLHDQLEVVEGTSIV